MKNKFNQMVAVATLGKNKIKEKSVAFLKEEKSAKGTSEEGYLMYAGLVIGLLALGIAVAFFTGAFDTIGEFFNDGVSGNVRDTGGWGN